MSTELSQDQLSQILQIVLRASKIPINNGETIIFNWRDEKHLFSWINVSEESAEKSNTNDDIRILRIESAKFPFFTIDQDPNDVTIVALAFGKEDDYSDLQSAYYMVVKQGPQVEQAEEEAEQVEKAKPEKTSGNAGKAKAKAKPRTKAKAKSKSKAKAKSTKAKASKAGKKSKAK